MTDVRTRPARIHPAWWVAAVTFLALVGAAGFRAVPGVLMNPLHDEFGWSISTISLAVAVNMALYGLTAPFAAALMERFGIRRVVTAALLVVAAGQRAHRVHDGELAADPVLGRARRARHGLDGARPGGHGDRALVRGPARPRLRRADRGRGGRRAGVPARWWPQRRRRLRVAAGVAGRRGRGTGRRPARDVAAARPAPRPRRGALRRHRGRRRRPGAQRRRPPGRAGAGDGRPDRSRSGTSPAA